MMKTANNPFRQSRILAFSAVLLLCATSFLEQCLAFTTFVPASIPTRTSRSTLNSEVTYAQIEEDIFENVAAAVFVPGFMTGSDEFEQVCRALTERGIPTVAAPMRNWDWLPSFGGNFHPILERIDFAVKHLVANLETTDDPILSDRKNNILNIPKYDYSLWDCLKDFRGTPSRVLQGGRATHVEDCQVAEPRLRQDDAPKKKIAIIGHSAGGWISRVYLSSAEYGGKAYGGADYIHSLVTLGTPHADAPGAPFEALRWINDPSRETDRLTRVRSLSVAGTGFKGDEWGDLTLGSYDFCSSDGTDNSESDGDGVTPVFSALAMPGSEALTIENVHHFCWSNVFGGDLWFPELTRDQKNGKPWYGSEGIIDQWANFILDAASPEPMSWDVATS